MKVLALTPGPPGISPGERFRLEQWEPHLRAHGVSIETSPFLDEELRDVLYAPGRRAAKARGLLRAFARQLGRARAAGDVDLVYVFREASLLGPAVIETLLAALGRPLVFDFDDATFLPYKSPTNGYWNRLKFSGKTKTLCRRASHVLAGNAFLAEYASKYNDRVTVVPTAVDTDRYHPRLHRGSGRELPTIGWTGSHSTAQHLELLVPALETLARERPFRLVVIGAEAPRVRGAEVESRPWTAETEVSDLCDVDVGIMPLPDEPWAKGKCGLKALQYMALGIPPVVSPVGVNTEIVEDGVNGFAPSTGDAWVPRLLQLIDDAELRARLGSRARATVEARYSVRATAPLVLGVFTAAASRAPARAIAHEHT